MGALKPGDAKMSDTDVTKTVNVQLNPNAQLGADADGADLPTLIVVSKVKGYIRDNAGLNTSSCAIEALSKKVMEEAAKGIENAKTAGRKTVMGRDIL